MFLFSSGFLGKGELGFGGGGGHLLSFFALATEVKMLLWDLLLSVVKNSLEAHLKPETSCSASWMFPLT